MSRIAIPAIESATGVTADSYVQVKKIASVSVPNRVAALRHIALASWATRLNAESVQNLE
jgi:hypothetical protein